MAQLPPSQPPDPHKTPVNPSPTQGSAAPPFRVDPSPPAFARHPSPWPIALKIIFTTILIIVGLVLLAVGLCFAYFFSLRRL
jgi:hypothetical protein